MDYLLTIKSYRRFTIAIVLLIVFFTDAYLYGASLYVLPSAPDDIGVTNGDPCVPDHCWQKIETAYSSCSDGDTIYLLDGIYDDSTQGAGWNIRLYRAIDISFESYSQENNVTLFPQGTFPILVDFNNGSKTVLFKSVDIINNTGTVITFFNERACTIIFEDSILTQSTNSRIVSSGVSSQKKEIIFENCELNCGYARPIETYDMSLIRLSNCVINDTGTSYATLYPKGKIGKILIENCIFNVPHGIIRVDSNAEKFEEIIIRNNAINVKPGIATASEIISIRDTKCGMISIEDNYLDKDPGANSIYAIRLGERTVAPGSWSEPIIKGVNIINNKFNFPSNDTGSLAILAGSGTFGLKILNNIVLNGSISFKIRSCLSTISGNIISSRNPLFCEGDYNVITNNTFISKGAGDTRAILMNRVTWLGDDFMTGSGRSSTVFSSNSVANDGSVSWPLGDVVKVLDDGTRKLIALVEDSDNINNRFWGFVSNIDDQNDIITVDYWRNEGVPGTGLPENGDELWVASWPVGNIVYNNIIDGSRASYCVTFDFNPWHSWDYFNYNCYLAGSGALSNLGSKSYGSTADLLQQQTRWSIWSDNYPLNDANSIEVDPLYIDFTGDDFHLRQGSPCLNTGKPGASGGYTTIGAWNSYSDSDIIDLNCFEKPQMDFNNDCKVDFWDFGIFAESWLKNNLQ